MRMQGRSIVITGAASGIGHALALRFAAEAPRGLILCDLPAAGPALARLIAQIRAGDGLPAPVEAIGLEADVGDEAQVHALVETGSRAFAGIDVFCSNAGVLRDGDEYSSDDLWQLNLQIHLMAHVYAARAVLPQMLERGEGYLMNTASAAGLLTSLPSATYAVSKHATIAFAEWLAIRHGDHGIRVSVLCPQAVDTPMIAGRGEAAAAAARDGILAPEALADHVIEAMDKERFLILPHPEVAAYFRRKGEDYDRWLSGMRRFAAITGSARAARNPDP